MTNVPHDRPEQLKQIESGLLEGERIIAVYDATGAGTGFLGLTDRRVIIQDKSFVGKKVAITSIPYSRVTSVSGFRARTGPETAQRGSVDRTGYIPSH